MRGAHWIIVPIVLPLMAGALALLLERRARAGLWPLSFVALLALLAVNIGLLDHASAGTTEAYLLGNWRAPFGIALALDRLSALMLVLTAIVALASLLYARDRDEHAGPHFHALFQFQLMGLNGAFLTADLFNLFVFFEVLLIASYGLVLHGGGAARLRASIHYIAFNLTGSAFFLIALAMLYAATGTLNMADVAQRIEATAAGDARLLQSAALLLLVVFCVKAALLPLYFWLPETYASACVSASALFAIMTKVGIYAIARVFTTVFGSDRSVTAGLEVPWLASLALGTVALAAIGVLAARRARVLAAYWVIGSAGTLLLALGIATERTLGAAIFYLIPSTLAAAALFLLIDQVAAARGATDVIETRAWRAPRWALALGFLVCAMSAAGLPPFAGFLAKTMIMQAALPTQWALPTWTILLAAAIAFVIAFARAGGTIFWNTPDIATNPGTSTVAHRVPLAQRAALAMLLAGLVGASVFADPLSRYTAASAAQLFERERYIAAVLGKLPVAPAWNPRAGQTKSMSTP